MGVRVRQKVKGKGNPWWVFVSHNGKRTSRKVGSKKAAEAAEQIEAELTIGTFNLDRPKPKPNFVEYAKKYLRFVELQTQGDNPQIKESTLEEYESVMNNHILPMFKDHRINSINKGDVRDFLITKSEKLSESHVSMIRTVMSNVFKFACDDELIDKNPTEGLTKQLYPKTGNRIQKVKKSSVFTKGELDQYLNTCETYFSEYYLFFLMAARTGMRLGELLALRWGDINLKKNFVWVKRSCRQGRVTKPKNGKSRKVDMSNQLTDSLRRELKHGFKDVNQTIFKYVDDNRQVHINCLHGRILKKAGLRHVKFHGFRHTFCAHLLSKDVPPYYVSQQAGHHSIKLTCDVYGEWVRDEDEDNRHVNLLDPMHPNAPYTHPERAEKSQQLEKSSNLG